MEPYRVSGFRCPTCPASPMREFQGRLICDECTGMLIDRDDYIAACGDLCTADLTLETDRDTPTETPCPRCERPLISVRATLMPVKIRADVLTCERHGLWFKAGALTAVFARIGRHGGHRHNPYGDLPVQRGLNGLPVGRSGPVTAGLAISQWHSRPRRRSPTATPINLYRDQRLACPACPVSPTSDLVFFGDRYQCRTCTGVFVQNAALESMVMDVSKQAWGLPAASGAPGPRACPVCTAPMAVETVERVPIDRCDEHGVWFDPHELRLTLENASGQFDPSGVRAWLKRLFS